MSAPTKTTEFMVITSDNRYLVISAMDLEHAKRSASYEGHRVRSVMTYQDHLKRKESQALAR